MMKRGTARKVICDASGRLAENIAQARGTSPQSVLNEAKLVHKRLNKRERQRRKS